MAIKGKKKPKQRSAPRPPRHEPVAPPTPFLHRRWVQLTAGFLVGAFAMIVLVWVTNSLRADDAFKLWVNDKLVAYGEVVVVEDHFGIKITELVGSGPQG